MQKGENSVLLSETISKFIMFLPPWLPTKENFSAKLSMLSSIGILFFMLDKIQEHLGQHLHFTNEEIEV